MPLQQSHEGMWYTNPQITGCQSSRRGPRIGDFVSANVSPFARESEIQTRIYFFSELLDTDSFGLLSFFAPESLSFDSESFAESPFPSESDCDSDFEAPDDFFA